MKMQKKTNVKKYIAWVLIVVLVAVLTALPLVAKQAEDETGPQASILSTTAQLRDISTVLLGSGTLQAEETVEITIPAAVKITEYLVSNGDIVTENQPVAAVDRVSIMTAVTQVQETLESLQKQLNAIRNETESNKVTAAVGGIVKKVCGNVGESVKDVILRDGALAVLSLDGLMAVQINRKTSLSAADTVCVTLSDGTEVQGNVESNLDGVLVITIKDKGFSIGEKVIVNTDDGGRIGSGELYIHRQWNVVAYSGTISSIRISEGQSVSAGRTLFNLQNTDRAAEFTTLSRQHREYEKLMLELFQMYQSRVITAPRSGMVTGVDKSGSYMLSDSGAELVLSLLSNAPNGDDSTSYINYVGQVTQVGTDGLILNINPTPIAISDYKDLSQVPLNTELMTQSITYSANAPIYELTQVSSEGDSGSDNEKEQDSSAGGNTQDGGSTGNNTEPDTGASNVTGDEPSTTPTTDNGSSTGSGTNPETGTESTITKKWVQISPYAITAGDILLFTGNDSGVVWVIRVSHAAQSNPVKPGGDTAQNGTSTPSKGKVPSGGGSAAQNNTDDLYSLETLTIASITAQENMIIQIAIDELDISKVHVGQKAQVTVEALPGEKFSGTVTSVSSSGENEGGNSKFKVDVAVGKAENMLLGMRGSVTITQAADQQVLTIPTAALVEQGTHTIVYTGYDDETKEFTNPATVVTGVSDGEYTQILSGLAEGEVIFYPYYDTLEISTAPEVSNRFQRK